jgi:hypothetical protein
MSRTITVRALRVVAALALVSGVVVVAAPSGAAPAPAVPADGPGVGTPWVVSLGDSYISGEGGRWAGNTDDSPSEIDALGPTAYFDNPTDTGELIPGCHRSKSAEVHIGGPYMGKNLACSGARTSTFFASNGDFKPGLDFFDDGIGHQGQAAMLRDFASSNNVTHIAISIGGNDFDFAPMAQTCVEDYAESTFLKAFYCSQDPKVTSLFANSAATEIEARIVTGLHNVRQAMRDAGYADGSYSVSVQNYVTPIPYGEQFRYPQAGYGRIDTGGCGFWDVDADWALNEALRVVNDTSFDAALASGIDDLHLVDVSQLTAGRRLCEQGVILVGEEPLLTSWSDVGAVDLSEWVNQVRVLDTVLGPYQLQEDLHPNYWAQLALRSCLRQVVNDGEPRGGTCVRAADGLDAAGEPVVSLEAGLLPIVPVTANGDRYSIGRATADGGPLVVAAPGVLANDTSDAEEPLVAVLVDGPAHGRATLLSDGTLTYEPAPGFVGPDTLTYRTANARATSDVVTVELVVVGAPAAAAVTPRFTG